ncbi:hypothetical protein MSG28_013622 [Choristoneura fumiferana]|uniref:Uncharacterized protein n=1 Tax=Choristoneura fumiferana TaxID=7141 RepID=A0ACC0K8A7_CHOFU|nr:hypothetical protein MSG28_013622 [Choristoneura fumiferana]
MLKYFLKDSSAGLVICTQEYENTLRPLAKEISKPLLVTGRDKEITAQLYQPNNSFMKPKAENTLSDVGKTNAWYGRNDALLIYTSGTTSKPKGVVWTHSMLSSQIASLHAAWRYSAQDVVLHALPLHHIHGQLNSLLASLIRMLPSFVSHTVWARLLGMGERDETKATVFHGVPAMYAKLTADHSKMFDNPKTAEYVRATLASRMRLMCAGSAPLPDSLFQKWEEISGHRLLERYGMSETGMALSNPYRPAEARTVGCVGTPLPGVAARIAAPGDSGISLEQLGLAPKEEKEPEVEWRAPDVTEHKPSGTDVYQGELLLKGPGVFSSVADAAVLGVEDESYGEIVSAVVVLKEQATLTLKELKDDAGKRLAPYQLPRNMIVVKEMPRNVMGKLDKKEIRKLYGEALAVKN